MHAKYFIMKKIAFTLFVIALFATTWGQDLKFLYNGQELSQSTDLMVTEVNEDNEFTINVVNNFTDTLRLYVGKRVVSEVEGSYNTFCLGVCLDPSISTSPSPLVLGPGDTSTYGQFHLLYHPGSNAGTTTVQYNFSDPQNEVSGSLNINFISNGVGINEQKADISLFQAYPNPASDQVVVQYEVSGLGNMPANIVITSLVGSKLRTIPVNGNSGKSVIDLSDFVAGIYFYSLEINGQTLATRKLIIK